MRRSATVDGLVQGVGFRPFVARLAADLRLAGLVRNEGRAVHIEVEGDPTAIDAFARRLLAEVKSPARIDRIAWIDLPASGAPPAPGEPPFRIDDSAGEGARRFLIPPDLRVCAECLAEIADPSARRRGYPFTNCTACGPRFTIVNALPYDRPRTSMAGFTMCEDCRREYADPGDRRYHAQPIACPACGPRLAILSAAGAPIASGDAALSTAAEAIRRGEIVALKGLGGYQLLCDATRDPAVERLRQRKRRADKPLAVMVPDLDAAHAIAHLSALEEQALTSAAAPIVLVRRRADDRLARAVAPGNARVGLMIPTTPLHGLLLARVRGPVVATSGNLHEDPISIDDREAMETLGSIADVFLTHDRPIVRRADDAVVHVVDGRIRAIRLARGLGPCRVPLPFAGPAILCAGGHLKNAPAAAFDGEVVLWPHVGDLDSPASRRALDEAMTAMRSLLGIDPAIAVTDAHPDYASTRWAEASGLPILRVQHHHAHAAACLAEHGVDEALAVVWDGTGLGEDGTAWGGEFLEVTPRGATRVAWLRPFPLPGGDAAARDGRRCLAGVLAEAGLPIPDDPDLAAFARIARAPIASPKTSSAGRLFDAVAALVSVRARSTFEGQAAMALEHAASAGALPYPFHIEDGVVDWAPMVTALTADHGDAARAASRFHATLAAMIAEVAARRRARTVALTGGCFQNALLAEGAAAALRERGIEVILPAIAPPNDGGLALGQAWVAARMARQQRLW